MNSENTYQNSYKDIQIAAIFSYRRLLAEDLPNENKMLTYFIQWEIFLLRFQEINTLRLLSFLFLKPRRLKDC